MSTAARLSSPEEVEYPDSDGEPMAENTLQYEWITTIKDNVEALFRGDPDVFVAGDLLWYPVEGDNTTRMAPDVMVALGRPKGHRGSYMQWREAGIAPQVVFEILSPGNRAGELARKFAFYEKYGVQEYYIYDPDDGDLEGYLRDGASLRKIPTMDGWVSPRLGIRFGREGLELRLFTPDGRPFVSYQQLREDRDRQERRAEIEHLRAEEQTHRAEAAYHRAEAERHRAEAERARAERLAAQLRALGIDPA